MKRAGGLVLVGVVGMLLSGCAGPAPVQSSPSVTITEPAKSTPTTTVTATTTPSATPVSDDSSKSSSDGGSSSSGSSGGSSASSSRTDPNAPKGQCADSELRVTVKDLGGGDGQRQTAIQFTNAGENSCVLAGFAGVSLVGDGNGTQIGKPAARAGESGGAVEVKPGRSVEAQLDRTYVDSKTTSFNTSPGHTTACKPKKADGYRIYPPHSFRAFYVEHPDTYGCTTSFVWMHIASVEVTK